MSLTRSQLLTGGAAVLAGALVLGGASGAAAQTATPVRRAGGPAGAGMRAVTGVPDAVLQKLGLAADQVAAERRAGMSLAQIAGARGVSRTTLIDLLMAEHQAALAARVKAGALTQAQADAALVQMRTRVAAAVDRTEVGPPAAAGRGDGLGLGAGFGARRAAAAGQPGQDPRAGGGRPFGPPWQTGG